MGRREQTHHPGRVRSILGWIVVAPWLAGLAAWLVGRAIGDRLLWTQYLDWIPTEAIVLSGLVVVLIEGLLRGRKAKRVRLPLLIVAGLMAWLLLGQWRLYRVVLPKADDPELRLTFMNISYGAAHVDLDPLFDAGGDVVVLSNVHPNRISFEKLYGFPPEQLLERATGLVPGSSPPSEVHLVRQGGFCVLSRWPVRRRASAAIGPQESWIKDDIGGGAGIAMFEIETPDGPRVVWAVDMPRTLGASRRALFEEAARRIRKIESVMESDEIGRWRFVKRRENDPLFTPDIVVGDFNTPGHAWSVSRFCPGLHPARADAGMGPTGTFPAAWPLFEIDLARLAKGVHATATGRIRCDGARHLGLWVDVR
ncbi:MAG: hypothetical protein H6810_03185 [Phycisphaeraceae bacterium]|nr:MAG: hypothetical protein H6810_03185 [Phycisphaeraceae bacterium]